MLKFNLWTIFYLIVMVAFGLFGAISYNKYQQIHEDSNTELANLTNLFAHSAHSAFVENELVLDILGSSLLENKTFLNQKKSQKLLKSMLKTKPVLAGFGLIDPQGNYIALSANIDPKGFPNLLQQPESREAFLETLQSDRMVIGNTYYFPPVKSWVIPLRKALRDDNGKVVAVMATGLRLDKAGYLSNVRLSQARKAMLVSDRTKRRILITGSAPDTNPDLYQTPVFDEHTMLAKHETKQEYLWSLNQAKSTHEPLILNSYSNVFAQKAKMSLLFNPNYQFWVAITEPTNKLTNQIISTILTYFGILLIILYTLFLLFKTIASYEKKARQKLIHQANHDPLTGLPNRNYLDKELKPFLEGSQTPFCLLFVDLDNFKNINDTFGHEMGDHILVEVSKRLQKELSSEDTLIRFGGDEFMILLFNNRVADTEISQRIIHSVGQPYLVGEMKFNLGASIGIAHYPVDADQLEALASLADIAMYQAKKRKNAVESFSGKMKEQALRKIQIEHHLRQAMANEEIFMAYQPQLDIHHRLHGVEALVRWQNPELGQVPPDEFIAIAEETGLMPELGDYILNKCLREISDLQQEIGIRFELSINISVRQFMEARFYENLLETVERYPLAREQIFLEVTESLFIEELDYIRPILQSIQQQGFRLSLDDFGTGYSSLSMLRELPFNELKIDKSFVQDTLNNKHDKNLVEMIIAIGKKLGMTVLAEGVETQEQETFLAAFECDLYQGYYFARPMGLNDLKDYILQRS
ncbi:bifunctional diguanylate cyclase/phosphodiesterase [Thiomicrorhabdus chilensis]|uniref:bifunctional diguanylate cyclase/phosphodiesterase n=1 Tax=Thiomicrorhabdus chilensis TaxID=63656 RepID=UPI00040B0CC1|nr:EAL domain-containing protein [Thiomicrorhabdus chilensis]